MKSVLVTVGWKKDMVEKKVPFLPVSGWMGDNLLTQEDSTGMIQIDSWKGTEVKAYGCQITMKTLYAFWDKVCRVTERLMSAPMRMLISGIYKSKGVGDVLAGRVEQSLMNPTEEVIFLQTHTALNLCVGRDFAVELHHQRAEQSILGDSAGFT